jgi:UDP-GlcNAc:undecaprenyl-phosphate GlcNAc-1-phosphate transferase
MTNYLFPIVTATAISLAIVPAMVRLAPSLGMMDQPGQRKVHDVPIPRVGGWGIVLGALVPVLVWVPFSELILSYVFGALVLLAFGAWDDRRELGHFTKFIGQFAAVLPVVTYGGLYVQSFPFLDQPLPQALGIPFTVIAMIGVINALNHSDGLDGLAGGEALLSLGGIVFLAYQADSALAIIITLAAMGGLLGFLRYNTHPASVFMGDGGSQFLGFTLAFLAVLLTQRIDTSLAPMVVLLLLGLPIVDILTVLTKRIRGGMNWFRATKNHIHHRLLELGFVHQESVVIIYSIQTLCVLSAIALRHKSDWVIALVYLTICGLTYFIVGLAEKSGWKISKEDRPVVFGQAVSAVRHTFLVVAPRRFLDVVIPAYLVIGSLLAKDVPRDFGVAAGVVFVLMVVEAVFTQAHRSIIRRALVYMTATFVIYLQLDYPQAVQSWAGLARMSFFFLVAGSVFTAIRFSPRRRRYEFNYTAMDYLMAIIVLITVVYSYFELHNDSIAFFVAKLVVVLYACELMMVETRNRWNILTLSSLLAGGILAFRGVVV